jgi:hypothetical protein
LFQKEIEKNKVSDYLEAHDKTTQRGRCKTCFKLVTWSRDRLASHKRAVCTSVSDEERIIFTKRKRTDDTNKDLNVSDNSNDASSSQNLQNSQVITKEMIDSAIGNSFYRTSISFRIEDSRFISLKVFDVASYPSAR